MVGYTYFFFCYCHVVRYLEAVLAPRDIGTVASSGFAITKHACKGLLSLRGPKGEKTCNYSHYIFSLYIPIFYYIFISIINFYYIFLLHIFITYFYYIFSLYIFPLRYLDLVSDYIDRSSIALLMCFASLYHFIVPLHC